MRVQSARLRALLVAPLRLALGVGWLVAARLVGAAPGPTYGAFGIGAFVVAFVALNDPRTRFVRRDPQPLPGGGEPVLDPPWRHVLSAAFPSTVGLSVLAAITLVPKPLLAALLGGASAGLGIAAAIAARVVDPALLVDPRTGALFRR